jgi:hypothetical protein
MQSHVRARKADTGEIASIEINIVYSDPQQALSALNGAFEEAKRQLMQAAPVRARDTRTY